MNLDECKVTQSELSDRLILRNKLLNKFWNIWSKSYIVNLPPVVKGFEQKCDIKKGSLVLIREDNVPRLKWPIGIVTEVFPGRDGLIRTVQLKTANNTIVRPIQKLHYLEINSLIDSVEKPVETVQIPIVAAESENSLNNQTRAIVTRYGRTVNAQNRL